MYTLRPTTKFRRDVKRCKKRGLNLDLLNEAFDLLTESGDLPESYGAHPLRGEYVNCIDAHTRIRLGFDLRGFSRRAVYRPAPDRDTSGCV